MTPFSPLPAHASSIADLLRAAAVDSDRDAVVFPEERETYGGLEARAHSLARSLRGVGVERGDSVALFMPNCLDYVAALLAIAKLGAVGVPINGRFKAFELGHVIADSDSRVLLTSNASSGSSGEFLRVLGEVFPNLGEQDPERLALDAAPAMRTIIDLGGRGTPGILDRAGFDAGAVTSEEIDLLQARVRVREPALLLYTSGTTAAPKGCVITHEAAVRQGVAAARRAFGLAPGEAFWDPLPIFHTGGITPILASLSMRTAFCHPGHFDPAAALRMIERERCAVLYVMFDTIWVPLIDHPDLADTDLSAVRAVYLVGPPDRMHAFQQRTPKIQVVSAFGMTEVCAHLAVAGPAADAETRLTTAGHIQPEMETRIIDPETGCDAPAAVAGELLFRGPFMFEGYYKQPEATAAAIDADGWYHSGDLVRIDAEGRFVFLGRIKDMLKVGGENVSPLEVEALPA